MAHPEADGDLLSAAYYQNIGRLLEQGRFDLLFIADILAIPDTLGGSLDSQLRYGALGALRLDPLVVLSLIASATKHIGLGATISTTYAQPYVLARALATLDHLSGGRAAWNIVTSFQEAEARNFGLTEQLSREGRYERADEFLEVVTKLWDSWRMARSSGIARRRCSPILRGFTGSIIPASGSMCAARSMSVGRRKDARSSSRPVLRIVVATLLRDGRRSSS